LTYFITKFIFIIVCSRYQVHAPDDVPDGLFFPKLSRFKIFADYKKAYEYENIQTKLLGEQKKLLKEIESKIKRNEAEYQQIKISPFQTERKAVQGSLKLLEAEIFSLRNWIEDALEVDAASSFHELKDLMKELVLLKVNGKNLHLLSEKLQKVICLNKKVIEIGLIVESLKKQSEPAHQNDIKLHRERVSLIHSLFRIDTFYFIFIHSIYILLQVLIQRPDMTNINQRLSMLKAEIEDTVLLVDRAPLQLLNQDDGFSPHSQFIVTTLNPGLLEYADSNIIGLRFDDATQVLPFFFLNINWQIKYYFLCAFQVEPSFQDEQEGSAQISRFAFRKLSRTMSPEVMNDSFLQFFM